MPEVHVPKLDEHEEDTAVATSTGTRLSRGKSLFKIALEVVLISSGVFLGLMGEQWRERAGHRELAEASLRRFRTEIVTNRKAVAAVIDYHVTTRAKLEAYLASDRPKNPQTFDVPFHGLGPVFFEQTAWDLALATQSLAYIDPDLAFALSRAYTVQRGYAAQQAAIMQSTIYGRSWTEDFEGYWRSVLAYYGDLSFFDPMLLGAYDDVLPQIDRALGESSVERTSST
jgi:uncharacterized protein YjeT (DUF2065 family)